jgi:hypothetical protein
MSGVTRIDRKMWSSSKSPLEFCKVASSLDTFRTRGRQLPVVIEPSKSAMISESRVPTTAVRPRRAPSVDTSRTRLGSFRMRHHLLQTARIGLPLATREDLLLRTPDSAPPEGRSSESGTIHSFRVHTSSAILADRSPSRRQVFP